MKPRSLEDIPVFYVFKVTCQHHYTATKIQYGQGIFTIDKNFDHGHNISRCSPLRWMLILFPNSVGHERVWNQYAGLCIQKVQIIFKPSKNSDLQKEMWCMFVSVYLTNWNLIYQTYRWSEGNIPENSKRSLVLYLIYLYIRLRFCYFNVNFSLLSMYSVELALYERSFLYFINVKLTTIYKFSSNWYIFPIGCAGDSSVYVSKWTLNIKYS